MFRKIFILTLLFGIYPGAIAADQCSSPGHAVKPGIVKILGDNAIGSGVVISNGHVLTAAHVIEGMQDISVMIRGKATAARVISRDKRIDLALLEVSTGDITPLSVRRSQLKANAPVWTLGYPFGKRLKTGTGVYRRIHNGVIYTSAPVNFGQSGGGLISCENGRHVLSGIIKAFGADYRDGKLVRRNDVSVATRTRDLKSFVTTSQQLASLTRQ
jgi:S1-C subfamily serine protease